MKYFTLLSLLLLLSTSSYSQNRLHFSLQALGGYSGEREVEMGSLESRPPTLAVHNYDIRTRWQPTVGLGAELLYPFGPRGSVTLGLDYLLARALQESTSSTVNAEGQITRYEHDRSSVQQAMLRMPLGYQFTFGQEEHRVRPFLRASAMVSYLVSLKLFKSNTSATLGQETQESFIADEIQLSEDRLDFSRWQFPLSFAVGIKRDRVSLSIERNWFIGEQIPFSSEPNFNCGLGVFNCFAPTHLFASTHQLQTTYLRFSYQLF